jgi:hypothetical protein
MSAAHSSFTESLSKRFWNGFQLGRVRRRSWLTTPNLSQRTYCRVRLRRGIGGPVQSLPRVKLLSMKAEPVDHPQPLVSFGNLLQPPS